MEELALISVAMNLAEPLQASEIGANLCFKGIPDLTRLPRGTLLKFSSGVVLLVEEFNPPCSDMGEKLAEIHTTVSGEPLAVTAFSEAAKFSRSVVGVVEVAGTIAVGDELTVQPVKLPKWLRS